MAQGEKTCSSINVFIICFVILKRKHEECCAKVEAKKDEFSRFEQQDVSIREELKHAKAKLKKLEKSLEQEKKKVFTVG